MARFSRPFTARFLSLVRKIAVISGFNTDINVAGTVYHVQTEDKGAPKYEIMSLVYEKGTILASKRAGYDDLGEDGFDEKEIADRVNRQHKLMCAAVKSGRINELKEMTAKTAAAGAKAKADIITAVIDDAVAVAENAIPVAHLQTVSVPQVVTHSQFEDEIVLDAIDIIEDDHHEILDAAAVEVVSELSGRERPSNQKLSLEMLGETKFKGGERKTVSIMVCRGTDRKVVSDAQIMIKVIGSAFRPVIFHARSNLNGLARVHLQLPHFAAGRAALLIRVITGGEEIELRRIVTPG